MGVFCSKMASSEGLIKFDEAPESAFKMIGEVYFGGKGATESKFRLCF